MFPWLRKYGDVVSNTFEALVWMIRALVWLISSLK